MAVHGRTFGVRGPRPPSHQWPKVDVQRKRQPHASVGTASDRQWGTPVRSTRQQSPQSNVPRISKSPDEVRKCAFSKVVRLQAAIASLDEDDQERSSLQQALKRAQQQIVLPPVPTRRARRCRGTSGRPPARSCKGRGCAFHNSTTTSNDSGLTANWRYPSRVGFRDSEVAHRGRQIQGTCESTSEGFGRSSPDCASGCGETPRRVDGRHAHRRTESEVLVGGQESGDARCSGCGRYRGNIPVGAVDRQGCRSHALDVPVRKCRRRVSVSVSLWRGAVRTLLREVRTPRCIARYGHRGTRVGEAAHPGPTTEMLDCIQEDSLPGSRRRVRRRIRDSDSEDALVRDGESPGVPRQQFGRFTALAEPTEPPRRRLVLVSSTQVDPVPSTVPDSVDSPSRRRRRVRHRGHPTVEEGAIYHDLTLIDSSDDDAPFVIPGSAVSPARPTRRVVLVPGSVDATPQSIQDRLRRPRH